MKHILLATFLFLALTCPGMAQKNKGLDKYDFFYTGQNFNDRRMSIVKGGHVVWSHHESEDDDDYNSVPGESNGIPGEISDAVWMNDNHILVAGQYQIYEVAVDTVNWTHQIVWRHTWTRADYEVHSVMPIGQKYVVYLQCGNSPKGGDRFKYNEKYPTKLIVRDIATWSIVRELDVPYDGCKRHNLNRSCTLTPWGTFVFASMEKDCAYEIDSHGKIVNEIFQYGLWGVEVCPGEGRRLLLTSENSSEVSEYDLDQANKKIWTYKWNDDPSIRNHPAYQGNRTGKFRLSVQKGYRLGDGTTVMTNWAGWDTGSNGDTFDEKHQPIQARGVDKAGKVVWELQSWNGTDYLGPATIFQLLSEPVNRNALYFGDIKGN